MPLIDNPTDDPYVNAVISQMISIAEAKKQSAAYGGERSDGGAGLILNEVMVFEAGWAHILPSGSTWKQAAKEVAIQTDPDYARYLQLKEKFETKNA